MILPWRGPQGIALVTLLAIGCADDVPMLTTTAGASGGSSTGPADTTIADTTTTPSTDDGVASGGQDTTDGLDTTDGPACGNAIAEPGEDCDGRDLAEQTCASLDEGFVAGRLACASDCTFDTTGCVSRSCGDGQIQDMELCDGEDLDGQDCAALGFEGGTLACMAGCAGFDTSGCFACGDDQIGGMEICDGSDLGGNNCTTVGFDNGSLGCQPDCASFDVSGCSTCGNNLREAMEACDGPDLDGQDCATQGFDFGMLGCAADCGTYDTSACGMFGGDCCSANGTPGCTDAACTAAVCATDPSCCDGSWGDTCAIAAFNECPAVCDDCGDGMINSPIEVCDGADLNAEDCSSQGFDYGTLGCTPDCTAFDTAGCSNYAGDCCSNNGSPGCDDPQCTTDVCATDSFCCDNVWDDSCANEAFILCPAVCDNCGDGVINSPVEQCDGVDLGAEDCVSQGGFGGALGCAADCTFDTTSCTSAQDCCGPSGGNSPGCSDFTCQASICAIDSFCCETDWDGTCADRANGSDGNGDQCGVCGFGCIHSLCETGAELSGCVMTNTCVAAVCVADDFCCTDGWDAVCTMLVDTVCGLTCPPP